MPRANSENSWLPNEVMFRCLANRFAALAAFKKPLRTFALGAVTYNIMVGSPHCGPMDYDFLKLRVYHVEYSTSILGNASIDCREVATGTADGAEGVCPNIDILSHYWLS